MVFESDVKEAELFSTNACCVQGRAAQLRCRPGEDGNINTPGGMTWVGTGLEKSRLIPEVVRLGSAPRRENSQNSGEGSWPLESSGGRHAKLRAKSLARI